MSELVSNNTIETRDPADWDHRTISKTTTTHPENSHTIRSTRGTTTTIKMKTAYSYTHQQETTPELKLIQLVKISAVLLTKLTPLSPSLSGTRGQFMRN